MLLGSGIISSRGFHNPQKKLVERTMARALSKVTNPQIILEIGIGEGGRACHFFRKNTTKLWTETRWFLSIGLTSGINLRMEIGKGGIHDLF